MEHTLLFAIIDCSQEEKNENHLKIDVNISLH